MHRAVTDSGVGREVIDACILAVEALRHQTLEAPLDEAMLIAVEVIPSHLVYHHRHDDAWSSVAWGCYGTACCH